MWKNLNKEKKDEYKRMILAFSSLTEMFSQKNNNNNTLLTPIINSKFQETIFQKVFGASAEDISNTSFDVALKEKNKKNQETKYLIGIKTFGFSSNYQKVAQFKAQNDLWSPLINTINKNSLNKTKEQINKINNNIYLTLAKNIAKLRNQRIQSSIANIKGFNIHENDNVEAIYHVLMPSNKNLNSNTNGTAQIHVGETPYTLIDINNLKIIGCTGKSHPSNFEFTDGIHKYKYTSADCQLYMDFDNTNIVKESWNVQYAQNAYDIFAKIAEYADNLNLEIGTNEIIESYSWKITNKNNEVELFSGFNSFYGVGSKSPISQRKRNLDKFKKQFIRELDTITYNKIISYIEHYLFSEAKTKDAKICKATERKKFIDFILQQKNETLTNETLKLLFRPKNELYIPIPNSFKFHSNYPNFFGDNTLEFDNKKNIITNPANREFNLIFEPSGDSIKAYITQQAGKAIESVKKQTYLGEWILRNVFQLEEYEPLTVTKLNELGINGIRLYKTSQSSDIHISFIWIDSDNPPEDYFV